MEKIRCYGKKTTVPKKEKSFIRKFFEGNQSSESSLFGRSSDDVLQRDSFKESTEKLTAGNLQSPVLFENISLKNLTPEKESFSIKEEAKTTGLGVKIKKRVKRKRIIKKKPKPIFHHSTKYYRSLQPNWGDIYRHNLTIERQRNNETGFYTVYSRNENFNERIPNKKLSKCIKSKNLSSKTENIQEKRNKEKLIFSSDSSGLDSSDDLFMPIRKKSFKKKSKKLHAHNVGNLKKKHNNDTSECKISELRKKFHQSMELGNFSVAPDCTLYINEDLYTKSSLNRKSPVSFSEWKELKELKISSCENSKASQNFHPVLAHTDNIEKRLSPNTSEKRVSSPPPIHVSGIFRRKKISPEKKISEKFITSTPLPKFKESICVPKNVGLMNCNFPGSNALSCKASPVALSFSDIILKNSLSFHDKENKGFSGLSPNNTASNKQRKSLSKILLSDLICSNKSMTLPEKKSVISVASLKNRSLFASSHSKSEPVEESDECTKVKLLKLCNQDSVASFVDVCDWKNCKVKKIGEGSFAEVFMLTKARSSYVLKIIPLSSEESTDDSYQCLRNVLSEVKITKCLSELRNNKRNQTKNFIKMNSVYLVSGVYPSVLIDAWDNYSETKSSYNERPDIYKENQMFVLLELEYGGKDMSFCVLRNALEAESVLKQVAATLAVAEEEFIFEHRDLHLGNILIQRNRRKFMSYKLRGKDISIECHGVQATLIDFTLSRLHEEGYIFYNDLAHDVSLFEQSGDYQFEVYKSMRRALGNQWEKCCLYSNVLWLKFLCRKFKEFEYSRPSTVVHKKGLKAIDNFNEQLTNCNSAIDCLTTCGITPLYFERSNTDSELTKKSILISRNTTPKPKLSTCY